MADICECVAGGGVSGARQAWQPWETLFLVGEGVAGVSDASDVRMTSDVVVTSVSGSSCQEHFVLQVLWTSPLGMDCWRDTKVAQ